MIVRQARDLARQWVREEVGKAPGFCGAFYHGSTNWLPDDAALPAASDVDVMVVFAEPPPAKLGKFIYRGVMLEVSYMAFDQLQSPELILGQSHLAGSFRKPNIIADPTGQLCQLQEAVGHGYAKREWVYRRCEHARDKVLQHLQRLNEAEPFHDQVTAWLFGTGVMTHVLLVAGLENPTVRRRYVATQQLLAHYAQLGFHESLLGVLGCAEMSRVRVEQHLAALTDVFDVASVVMKTPFPFSSDLSEIARPIAIDGSREMIESGCHREAVFWIVATYSRCQKVLHCDGTAESRDRFSPGYRRLLGDLGITSFSDLQRRSKEVKSFLPRVWEVAEAIIAANPDIEG